MSVRKKVLMIALASLVCFQPQVKADDSLWFRAMVIIGAVGLVCKFQPTISKALGTYPVTKSLGDVFSRAKQFVTGIYEKVQKSAQDYLSREQELSDLRKEVAELKTAINNPKEQSIDNPALEHAKLKFNEILKEFQLKDNVAYAQNVFKNIGNLEATISGDRDSVVNFCNNREKIVDISNDHPKYIQGLSLKFIDSCQNIEIKQEVEKMKMTKLEYEDVYSKVIDQVELPYPDFSKLLTYIDQQFTDRRRSRNKKIINFCFAQIGCQEDAAKKLKTTALDYHPTMIILKSREVAQEQKRLTDRTGQALQLPTQKVLAIFAADR